MREIIAPLSQMLKSGEISSVELTNKYINAIENDNPKYNAYVSTTFEKALENAKFADKLIAEGKSSALTGIPMTLKDNICSDGDLTTCCSKILEGFRPYYDSTVWTKLKAQGAVMLGKTNMDEFAMGSTSETSVYGAPLNPRNTNHVTGGSSGGVAAAVCANIAAYGLGSDTGGSVRQPASFCGIVGLKPTYKDKVNPPEYKQDDNALESVSVFAPRSSGKSWSAYRLGSRRRTVRRRWRMPLHVSCEV